MRIPLLTQRELRREDAPSASTGSLDPVPVRSRRQRLRSALPIGVFVYLTSTIMVMASERIYWYWAGFNVDSVLFLGGFYLVPTMAGLWTLALAPARRIHQVILAGAIFAFVVEGVLTPIIYIDGPLPLMASMFIGWHGLISFVGFWYLIRRWLLDRRVGLLAAGSLLFGALWGVWAMAAALGEEMSPEEIAELGVDPVLLNPTGFATYAAMVVATLAVSHWVIGFVWPTGWRPGKASTRILIIVSATYMAAMVLPVFFWAPLKLAVMIGGTWRLMRRASTSEVMVTPGEPRPPREPTLPNQSSPSDIHQESTILDQLAGRVRLRDSAPLLLMALAASSTYTAMWQLRDWASFQAAVFWSLIGLQIVAGAVAFLWAWRRARRQQVQQFSTKTLEDQAALGNHVKER